MRTTIRVLSFAASAILVFCQWAPAANYQNTVLSLNPSHYWQLNETEEGAVIDSVGGLNGVHAGFIDGGIIDGEVGAPGPGRDPDGNGEDLIGLGDGNLAFAANNISSIDLGPGSALAANTMTLSAWFYQDGSEGGDRLWTNNQTDPNTSFQIAFGGGFGDVAASLVVGLNPAMNGFPSDGSLPSGPNVGNFHLPDSTYPTKDGSWHHIVASRNGNNIEDVLLVIDGIHFDVDTWADSTDTWGTTGSNSHIATRTPGDGGGAQQALNGRVDEVAIWLGRQLTVQESIDLYNSAFTEGNDSPGDFDGNGAYECADIDLLMGEIAAGTNSGSFDLTGDGNVDLADRDEWLAEAATANGLSSPYLLGDANLSGSVDVSDFNIWNMNKFTNSTDWCAGNFNGDMAIDVSDFNIWNMAKFTSSDDDVSVVPEPSAFGLLVLASIACMGFRRRFQR